MKAKIKNSYIYDKAGIFFSSACAIHCLTLPTISFFSPSLTVYLEQEWIHKALLILLLPIALFSLNRAHREHQRKTPLIIGILGITFLIAAVLIDDLEKILTVSGSVLLILAHGFNIKFLNKSFSNEYSYQ